jgi:AcrR family transcriptional regulator
MATHSTDNPIAHRIFEAAVRLFARKGYAAASTREIVEEAGVTKPMLYYYFESKEGLCRAMLDHYLNPFHERLRQIMESSGPARERLVEVVWAYLDFCRQNMDFARLFYALYFGPSEQSAELGLETCAEAGKAHMARAAEQACQAGLVEDAERLKMGLHGMINIHVMAALKGQAQLERPLAGLIVDGLLDGLGRQLGTVQPSRERAGSC